MGLLDFLKKKNVEGDGAAAVALPADVAKDAGGGGGGKKAARAADNTPDPRKARKFFDYARTVSDARNYDYAIVCWVNGLKHDPENMDAHEKLREVALRRMVAGGKAAGMRAKKNMPSGRTAADKMLAAEFLWAHDPLSATHAMNTMAAAAKAELFEVAYWVAGFALEANDTAAKGPNKAVYLKIKDVCSQMKAWDKAVEAQRRLVMMAPNDMPMLQELKQLEAEATVSQGGYGEEGTSFRRAIKDADKQKALEEQDAIAATDTQVDSNIERSRAEYEDNSESVDLLNKLVRALLAKQSAEAENEALSLLEAFYEKTGMYQVKMQVGDIKMKQYARRLRALRKKYEEAHVEATRQKLQEDYQALRQEQLAFELAEFEERVKNYPTKMDFRFHLGLRQFARGDVDQAIASFQEAKSDPKNRAQAMRYLGEAFFRKHWYDEANDTFNEALKAHPTPDDRLGLDLRYFKMMALEAKARRERNLHVAAEALKVASQIAQTDYNFRDVRQHIEVLRKLADEMKPAG